MNPDDSQEFVNYLDNGACIGCQISNIGTYFPDLKDWAEEQGFPAEDSPEFTSRKLIDANHLTYTLQAPQGYILNGAAYQEHGEGGGVFRNQKVQMKASSKDAASAILHFFVSQNK
ncbi:DUF4850 domain-containing protein [Paenibacillus hexagrammi]|uniref:DUF4850 domain-containing protein n=1 Tax=Paenibacillus hexagrammi TaxID=2908839 RepID=A0ABY3SC97_9BACL|nr:DUF4850 domain-containing protein [Paenibacillus sp. YPD9-1]UJF31623.1 DUF4850 domain-containing protein [Paenibacillus sp. YPD9-1]